MPHLVSKQSLKDGLSESAVGEVSFDILPERDWVWLKIAVERRAKIKNGNVYDYAMLIILITYTILPNFDCLHIQ